MKGSTLSWLLAVALALVLVWRCEDARRRLQASRVVWHSENVLLSVYRTRQAPPGFVEDLEVTLEQAAALDPLEVGIPQVLGSLHLLYGDPDKAIRFYEQALELEPRPETYLNLGRALERAGRTAEAQSAYEVARRLYPRLRP